MLQHGEIPRQLHFTRAQPPPLARRHVPGRRRPAPSVAGRCRAPRGRRERVRRRRHQRPRPGRGGARRCPAAGGRRRRRAAAARPVGPVAARRCEALAAELGRRSSRRRRTPIAAAGRHRRRAALAPRPPPGRRRPTSRAGCATGCDGFLAGDPRRVAWPGQRPPAARPASRSCSPARAPQWSGMGRELVGREPVVPRRAGRPRRPLPGARPAGRCVDALAEPAATSRLQDTEVAQPAIFAVQVALAALWRVVGHRAPTPSSATASASWPRSTSPACCPLDDAVRVVWHRGRIMQRATGMGRMTAVALDAPADARACSPARSGRSSRSPPSTGRRSVVLAGTPAALDARPTRSSTGAACGTSALPVSTTPSTRAQMAPLAGRAGRPRSAPFAPQPATAGRLLDGDRRRARPHRRRRRLLRRATCASTVRFADAVEAMLDDRRRRRRRDRARTRCSAGAVAECLADARADVPVVGVAAAGPPERETMLQACAGVYAAGRAPRWEAPSVRPVAPVDLPAYPWQRRRYWLPQPPPGAAPPRGPRPPAARPAPRSPAIGGDVVRRPTGRDEPPGCRDHVVGGHVVMPATGLLEALRAAAAAGAAAPARRCATSSSHRRWCSTDGDDGWRIGHADVRRSRSRVGVHGRSVAGDGGDRAPPLRRRDAHAPAAVATRLADAGDRAATGTTTRDRLYARPRRPRRATSGPRSARSSGGGVGDGAAEGWLEQRRAVARATGGACTRPCSTAPCSSASLAADAGRRPAPRRRRCSRSPSSRYTVAAPVPRRVRAEVRGASERSPAARSSADGPAVRRRRTARRGRARRRPVRAGRRRCPRPRSARADADRLRAALARRRRRPRRRGRGRGAWIVLGRRRAGRRPRRRR